MRVARAPPRPDRHRRRAWRWPWRPCPSRWPAPPCRQGARPTCPSGWPSAMAPPRGLMWSANGSRASARQVAMACAAKASFNSIRSISDTASPCRSQGRVTAGTGPMPMTRGATPAEAAPTYSTSGVRPWRATARSDARSSAAAPSLKPDGAADIVADKDAGHCRCAVASISTSASSSIRPATTTMDMAGKCRPNTSR